jgi:GT2 family glycosyltransferase
LPAGVCQIKNASLTELISIIICSRTAEIPLALKNNIETTIGAAYEVICIDNSNNKYSIFEAYNIGVKKSQYPYLCFMHDDIMYHTSNWGLNVINHFNHEKTGAIGVVGSPYYPFMPAPWWGSGVVYGQIIQSEQPGIQHFSESDPNNLQNREVVILDGFWFCIKKACFNKVGFDDKHLKGFHLYDADICLQMYEQKIRMYCVPDILIHHTSIGATKINWIANALAVQKKWRSLLPASCIPLANSELCKMEYKALNAFIWICSDNNFSNKKTYSIALKYLLKFKKGLGFYKTPGYFIKFLFKLLFKKGQPFYN